MYKQGGLTTDMATFSEVLKDKMSIGITNLYNETSSLQGIDTLELNMTKTIMILEELNLLDSKEVNYLQSLNKRLYTENEDIYNHKNNIENYNKELMRRVKLYIVSNIGTLPRSVLLTGLDVVYKYTLIDSIEDYTELEDMILDYYGED